MDLNAWINDPPSESSEEEDVQLTGIGATDIFVNADRVADGIYSTNTHSKQIELTEDELEMVSIFPLSYIPM